MEGFPGGSVVNNSPAYAGDAGDVGLIPGLGRSPGGGKQHTPVFLLRKSLGQRSYSPWGHKRIGHDLAMKQQEEWNNYYELVKS